MEGGLMEGMETHEVLGGRPFDCATAAHVAASGGGREASPSTPSVPELEDNEAMLIDALIEDEAQEQHWDDMDFDGWLKYMVQVRDGLCGLG